MMSTKLKPTWRHTTWNSTNYTARTVAEPQKKLPVFRPDKRTVNAQRKIALCGHDAKNMKNFTLHFENGDQCEIDRLWFGAGQDEPELCFSRSQARDPAYALLDSGATHVLLPGHTLPRGTRSFEVIVNLAIGKETCTMLEKRSLCRRQSPSSSSTWETGQPARYQVCLGEWSSIHAIP